MKWMTKKKSKTIHTMFSLKYGYQSRHNDQKNDTLWALPVFPKDVVHPFTLLFNGWWNSISSCHIVVKIEITSFSCRPYSDGFHQHKDIYHVLLSRWADLYFMYGMDPRTTVIWNDIQKTIQTIKHPIIC